MKQIALSLAVLAASGAYVWDQSGKHAAEDLIGSALPAASAQMHSTQLDAQQSPAKAQEVFERPVPVETQARSPVAKETVASISPPIENPERPANQLVAVLEMDSPRQAAPPVAMKIGSRAPEFATTPAAYAPIPQPRPAYSAAPRSATKIGAKLAPKGYADGAYVGPAADAYYGIIQIQALVQGGRLTALKILKYPSDRRTSISINRHALPILRDEAISAQSADVDIISGATLTSRAFIQSLGGALRKAST
jgi:uncharacterized protein with FMN-binding domain